MIFLTVALAALVVGLILRLVQVRKTLAFLTRVNDDHGCNQPVRHRSDWMRQIKIYCPHCNNNRAHALREARAIIRRPL